MQRRQIRYYDILGNICMKTIYVPKTFREFYSPNLELDTSLIEPVYAAINDKGSIISTSEKKKFHDMMDEIMDLHRKLSNGEQLIYYDLKSQTNYYKIFLVVFILQLVKIFTQSM